MGHIKKLDEQVIHRIAAGEVIQRPVNAIKELLENSLDAGSTHINVHIQDGGFKSFTIQDDGHGITKEDIPLLCERYATSKLNTVEDLKGLVTFGFRGEALASISHISRLSIITKIKGDMVGYKSNFLDGKLVGEINPVAANQGTSIIVQDLFYNNPVRLSTTSQSKNEEYNKILDVIQKYSINNSGKCAFSCRRGSGSADFISRLDQSSLDIMRSIHGEKLASSLLDFSMGDIASGYISNSYYQQKSFSFIFFVNGRLVDHGRLKRLIGGVYSEILMTQAFPFVFLSLIIPPDRIDVNIHPTKREVFFLEEDFIVDKIVKNIRDRLCGAGIVRTFIPKIEVPISPPDKVISAVREITAKKSTIRPFQKIHTDSKDRSLDFFALKRTKIMDNVPIQNDPVPPLEKIIARPPTTDLEDNPFVLKDNRENVKVESNLAQKIKTNFHRDMNPLIKEMLTKHTFVGILPPGKAFIQFESSLLLVDLPRLVIDWTFQYLLFNLGEVEYSKCNFDISNVIEEFIKNHPIDDSVDKTALISEISLFVAENSINLEKYLGIKFGGAGVIQSLPNPFSIKFEPMAVKLGSFLFSISIDDNDWENEGNTVIHLLKNYSKFISDCCNFEDREFVQYILLDKMRKVQLGLPDILMRNGSIIKLATTHDLYKIFERC